MAASFVVSASPTTEEMATWSTVADAMTWAGFVDDALVHGQGLLDLLGYTMESSLAEFGSVTASDFSDEAGAWKVGELKPNLALRNKAKRLGHAARVYVGVDYTVTATQEYEAAQAEHARALELIKAKASASSAAPPVTAPQSKSSSSTDPPARKIAIKDITDTGRTDEIAVIDNGELDELRRRYNRETNSRRGPPPEAEPTAEQLSVLRALLKERSVPYTDFSLWGPYGGRTLRKLQNMGLFFSPDGTLHRHEFRGPPTYDHWEACWAVYAVAMVMLGGASLPVLTAYRDFIKSQVKQFGQLCWGVLYQEEVRFRREHLERLRREESDKLDEAIQAGGKTPFDPLTPWERCYDIAPDQFHYWNSKVTVPCMLIVAKARAAGFYIDGDCQVAISALSHLATSQQPDAALEHAHLGLPTPKRTTPPPAGRAPKQQRTEVEAPRAERVHNVDGNGNYTTNRNNAKLCPGWQSGSCKDPRHCPDGLKHQCAKCLSQHHGSAYPSQCTASPKAQSGGKVKGGGRGKRGKGK